MTEVTAQQIAHSLRDIDIDLMWLLAIMWMMPLFKKMGGK